MSLTVHVLATDIGCLVVDPQPSAISSISCGNDLFVLVMIALVTIARQRGYVNRKGERSRLESRETASRTETKLADSYLRRLALQRLDVRSCP